MPPQPWPELAGGRRRGLLDAGASAPRRRVTVRGVPYHHHRYPYLTAPPAATILVLVDAMPEGRSG
jgi:hypothetical protein